MDRAFLAFGAWFGFFAVAFGAFGSHALSARLAPERIGTFEIGVRYQLYHGLAMFVVVFLRTIGPDTFAETLAGILFIAGVILFSGSLYLLAITGVRRWGAVTPFGGLCLLGGWLLVAWAIASTTFRFA
ncbi:MAG TPA: DUF423 domain-containing protein [Actinomycetota bacterium]|jgi:uncharacterized membrane protein YgdD (TMEM256/DUF423 family)|nr:DUF423 domain-containing protein [Actinomycetota bacterium]